MMPQETRQGGGGNTGLETVNLEELKGLCIVCWHKLEHHIDEGSGWRCHALGPDARQCECFLRKERARGNIKFYDLHLRLESAKKEGLWW